jgi:hypothetical protein
MMDRLALEKEKFEAILERFEADVGRAKELGDYSQTEANTDYVNSIQVPAVTITTTATTASAIITTC